MKPIDTQRRSAVDHGVLIMQLDVDVDNNIWER
jgi:hypothetical protein